MHWLGNLSRLSNPRVDKSPFGAVDDQRGQDACSISPCINADAIGAFLNRRSDRMAVHDREAVIGLIEQKRLADPAQVRLRLLLQLDARSDAGMNEQIVPEAAG